LKIIVKIDVKIVTYNCFKIWSKSSLNLTQKWPPINWSKIAQKLICHGGVQNDEKSINFDLGDPGPQKQNFLKFRTFLQKLSTFRPPKSTPINGPIKISFPTKTPVLFVQWGSKKVTFWGVGGRTARTEKCRHYYIAIFAFRGSKVVPKNRFFTPTRSHT
jgi:hypothetical protein